MALTPKRRPSAGQPRRSTSQWKASSASTAQPAVHSTNEGVHRFLLNGSASDHSAPSVRPSNPASSSALSRSHRNQQPARRPSKVVASAGSVPSRPSGSWPRPLSGSVDHT